MMAVKLTDYKIGDNIIFEFIGIVKTGKVLSHQTKDNCWEVQTIDKMFYRVHFSEKESKFCFLKIN
jgi:ABC-type taurine transport system substrate-binding protein